MAKRKISVEEFTNDVLAGMTDSELMEKYRISRKHLDAMFAKLLQRGELQASDLNEATQRGLEPTLELAATCPHCGALNLFGTGQCPECGQSRLTRHFKAVDTQDAEALPADSRAEIPEEEPVLQEDLDDLGDLEGLDDVELIDDAKPAAPEQEIESEPIPSPKPRSKRPFLFIAAAALFVLVALAAAGLYTEIISLPFSAPPSPPVSVKKTHPKPTPWGHAPKKVAAVVPPRETQPPKQVPQEPVKAPPEFVPAQGPTKPPSPIAKPVLPEQKAPEPPAVPVPTKHIAPAKTEETARVHAPEETPPQQVEESAPEQPKVEPPVPTPEKPAAVQATKEPAQDKAKESLSIKRAQETAPSQALKSEAEQPKKESVVSTVEKPGAVEESKKTPPAKIPQLATVSPIAKPDLHPRVEKPATILPAPSQPPAETQPDKEKIGKAQSQVPRALDKPKPAAYWQGDLPSTARPRMEEPPAQKQRVLGPLLIEASKNGDRDMMNVLMNGGANPDSADSQGATPLMFAARTRCVSCVAALLKRGADVRLKDRHGDTALDMARRAGRTRSAELILAHDPEKGPAALLIASREGLADLVQCLVDNGVDVNATDRDGNTALMAASETGNLDIVNILLRKGADVRARNKQGQTALTKVSRSSSATGKVPSRIRRELVHMLEQHTTPGMEIPEHSR